MSNAINFFHNTGQIMPSNDGKLFVKENKDGVIGWNTSNANFFSGTASVPPSSLGQDGDYYAKYTKKSNKLTFSEDFNSEYWKKSNTTITKEPLLIFPTTASSKMTATTEKTEHSISTSITNSDNIHTFSLFVQPNELTYISLSFLNNEENMGVRAIANLNNGTIELETIGDQTHISESTCGITRYIGNVWQIWVSSKIAYEFVLTCKINLCNSNGDIIFSTDDNTHGLFINGAQIVDSEYFPSYLPSTGDVIEYNIFDSLYIKANDIWEYTNNSIFHIGGNIPVELGIVGDVAFIDSMLGIEPALIVGDSTNLNNIETETILQWDQQSENWIYKEIEISIPPTIEGLMYYNKETREYIVVNSEGHYALPYAQKDNRRNILRAITLNQQTYQTYHKYGQVSHLKGVNTGGCYNFWNFIKKN